MATRLAAHPGPVQAGRPEAAACPAAPALPAVRAAPAAVRLEAAHRVGAAMAALAAVRRAGLERAQEARADRHATPGNVVGALPGIAAATLP